MILTQTGAIFYDAYRALRARKMFWIVLILSGLVVLAFAAVGIDRQGIKFFTWRISDHPNTVDMSPATMYKWLFKYVAIDYWLAWIASILALISTAGIFPDFMTSGSIDLVLCKPIGRVRLFLTQYAAGLLFVVLQMFVFCLASFLVIGIRGGAWEFGLFLAVPLVTCFFSYLFGVCVFWGVTTRSTVAAILLTILVWFLLWAVHKAEGTLLLLQLTAQQKGNAIGRTIAPMEAQARRLREPATQPASGQAKEELRRLEERLSQRRADRDSNLAAAEGLAKAQRVIYWIKTFLPKTAETVDLTGRILIRTADLGLEPEPQRQGPAAPQGDVRPADTSGAASPSDPDAGPPDTDPPIGGRQVLKEYEERMRGRSPAWVVGTSLAFEAVILAFAALIFRRRDF